MTILNVRKPSKHGADISTIAASCQQTDDVRRTRRGAVHIAPIYFASAARTRLGVNGARRTRAPVAAKIAFAIAGAVVIEAGSAVPTER